MEEQHQRRVVGDGDGGEKAQQAERREGREEDGDVGASEGGGERRGVAEKGREAGGHLREEGEEVERRGRRQRRKGAREEVVAQLRQQPAIRAVRVQVGERQGEQRRDLWILQRVGRQVVVEEREQRVLRIREDRVASRASGHADVPRGRRGSRDPRAPHQAHRGVGVLRGAAHLAALAAHDGRRQTAAARGCGLGDALVEHLPVGGRADGGDARVVGGGAAWEL